MQEKKNINNKNNETLDIWGKAVKIIENGFDYEENKASCFGNLTTVQKSEINTYEYLQKLINFYINKKIKNKDKIRPLSIAVFGSPGSGKSFGVEEIIKKVISNICPSQSVENITLKFNMSQCTDENKFFLVMKKITKHHFKRDNMEVLFCFFDEFDASYLGKDLYWLQRFIMPMWDGAFYDEKMEVKKFSKKCVFIFAGGKNTTYGAFKDKVENEKTEKGMDFISRLSGKLDIQSINYEKDYFGDTRDDTILQRAILIRNFINEIAKEAGNSNSKTKEDIRNELINNRPLINALLGHDRFEHGVRSLQFILDYYANNLLISNSMDDRFFEHNLDEDFVGLSSLYDSIVDIHIGNKDYFIDIFQEGRHYFNDKEKGAAAINAILEIYIKAIKEERNKEKVGIKIIDKIKFSINLFTEIRNKKAKYEKELQSIIHIIAKRLYNEGYLIPIGIPIGEKIVSDE